jgi:DNA ligase-4
MEISKQRSNRPVDPHTLHKVESHIQAKIDSGYTAPCGWLFRGLTFYFSQAPHANEDGVSKTKIDDVAMCLARNTARFASANIATSLRRPGVTHVIVNPALSRENIGSLRDELASRAGKKIPHLVSLDWVQECWKNGTLLDEDRKFTSACNLMWQSRLKALTRLQQGSRYLDDDSVSVYDAVTF